MNALASARLGLISQLWRAVTLTLVALLMAHGLALSEPTGRLSDRSRQKQAAEQERAELRKKLSDLKEDIVKTEKARGDAADALAGSEAAISNANRALRELGIEQDRTKQQLRALSVSQEALKKAVGEQRERLELMLRDQYANGQDDRLRLLLSGDNPNRIARELRYLGYVSAEQVKAITALQKNLAAIEANKAAAEKARESLEEIAKEQREQKALLEKEKGKRKALVGQLSGKLAKQRKEAGRLERDEERLAALVDRLATLLAQQRKAEEEEARRRARQRAEAKERTDRKKTSEKPGEKVAGKPADGGMDKPADRVADRATDKSAGPAGDKPRNTEKTADPEPPAAPPKPAGEERAAPPDGTGFASLRGKLKMPVKGELLATFGAKRAEGPSWKGLFIKAAEGTEIRAAGAGEVIFSDWMRGFGNLIIIDHGAQYMTIYGNNQSLLKRPGDRIKTGEVIATAGNSGGNEQSGLYFEMRHQGRALDPLTWMNR
jgi:septal ring factor EnvC (AmiA/AmiB activator)